MKKLLRLALIYAGLFVILSAVPIVMLYLELEANRVRDMFPDIVPASHVQEIETLHDPDALRRVCRGLAIRVDHFSEFLQLGRESSEKVMRGLVGNLLLLTGIVAGAFLHVAWEIRKLLRTEASSAKHGL